MVAGEAGQDHHASVGVTATGTMSTAAMAVTVGVTIDRWLPATVFDQSAAHGGPAQNAGLQFCDGSSEAPPAAIHTAGEHGQAHADEMVAGQLGRDHQASVQGDREWRHIRATVARSMRDELTPKPRNACGRDHGTTHAHDPANRASDAGNDGLVGRKRVRPNRPMPIRKMAERSARSSKTLFALLAGCSLRQG